MTGHYPGILAVVVAIAVSGGVGVVSFAGKSQLQAATDSSTTLDHNETTHLVFMREEEKLARDVYYKLGELYPNSDCFGNIDDSEQRHTTAVRDMLALYGVPDPSTNDNPGVYTGAEYGWYFTEKYQLLTTMGAASELEALKVGALIEELDMYDINLCPKIIVEQDEQIDSPEDCGRLYTDNPNVYDMLGNLVSASENHLRAFVKNIEELQGFGTYEAQYLPQEQVDQILGR